MKRNAVLSDNLIDSDLSIRAYQALKANNITTFSALSLLSLDDFIDLGLSTKTMTEIMELMKSRGITFLQPIKL